MRARADRPRPRLHRPPVPGHPARQSARVRGKAIVGAAVTGEHMLPMALYLRDQDLGVRDIAARLVITSGKKKGRHPSAATVLRMLRDHDQQTAAN
ncbi:hypothetical protein [Thermocatellispora tengchongensis]